MAELHNVVAHRRRARALTATALAERVGISRQALSAIEAGRSAPSTAVALRLASALSCTVEDLFALPDPRVRPAASPGPAGTRVAVGRVGDRWVAHPLAPGSTEPADGLVTASGEVELLDAPSRLKHTVLVTGCAPVLGALAGHLSHLHDSGARWLHRTSGASLQALADGRTHLAGLHLAAADDPATHDRLVRERLPGESVHIVGLVGWREGLAVAPDDPHGIGDITDLARPGLRVGLRPEGSGAAQVLAAALADAGLDDLTLRGRPVGSHLEAAAAILHGVVDAAVVIEPVAAALGLPFLPLSEERFELAVRHRDLDHPAVSRLLERLSGARFAREVRAMGAYDTTVMGVIRAVEAAA